MKEAQQKMVVLLPPLLRDERKPSTLQKYRLVHYIAFLEMLVLISRINCGKFN